MRSSIRSTGLGISAVRWAVGCVAGLAILHGTGAAMAGDSVPVRVVGSPYWNPSGVMHVDTVDMPVEMVVDRGAGAAVAPGGAAGVTAAGGAQGADRSDGLSAESAAMQLTMSVPAAEAEAVRAEWTFRAFGSALRRSIDQMRSDFESSPEHLRAMADFQRAADAYAATQDRALASIRASSEHRDLQYLRQKLGQQLREQHASAKPDVSRIQAVAQLRMEMLKPLRGIESERLAGDPDVLAARQEMMRAYASLQEVRRSFAREVRDHDELLSLRQMKDQARIEHLVASKFASSSASARDRALRFAAYGQRLESRRPTLAPIYGYGHDDGYGYTRSIGIIDRNYPWIVKRN